MNVNDILKIVKPLPRGVYNITTDLHRVEPILNDWAADYVSMGGMLQMVPDFQRGHVWTKAQQVAYIESLMKGVAPKTIRFATGNWISNLKPDGYMKNLYCLDGLQRVTAVIDFVNGEFAVCDGQITYAGNEDYFRSYCKLEFEVLEIETREELLETYIAINAGGTAHPTEEINRVKGLLEACK